MLGPLDLYDGPSVTHLIDWSSNKIERKVASTLAAEGNGASKAYDRAMWVRAIAYEMEHGRDGHWHDMARAVPFCLGTDCRNIYDNCIKPGSVTKEKRVALDLLDVREGVEYFCDKLRWVPTDHMLVDCLTKNMPPALLMKYLDDYVYSFKCDALIQTTK